MDGKPVGISINARTTIGDLLEDLAADAPRAGGLTRVHVSSNDGLVGLIVLVLGADSVEQVDQKISEIAAVWNRRNRERPTALH